MSQDTRIRLDKWLWAARFYKTRALAAEEIGRGRVSVNGQLAKGRPTKRNRRQLADWQRWSASADDVENAG